jgi:hypothetical protein
MKATFDLARLREHLLPVLALIFVAGSVFYAGLLEDVGRARDVDTQYFYVAAKCWATGHSPYDPARFAAVYSSVFGSTPPALFVAYLPTLMLVVLPMAPFDWPVAARLFSILNFMAAIVLFWACWRLVREYLGMTLGIRPWFWICLACTIGGIAGTIATGQTSLFTAAAMAVALVGCRLQNTWLIVVGLVIASAKPHLSGPLLLMIVLFEPRQRKAVAIAIGVIAVVVAYAAFVDQHLLASYMESMNTYKQLAANDPVQEVGFVSLLLRTGFSSGTAQALGAVGLAGLLALVGWRLARSGRRLSHDAIAMMLLIFSIGLAKPIQAYDVCCYAPAIALLCTLRLSFEYLLLLPSLLVWRPAIAGKLHVMAPINVISTFAAIVLLAGVVAIALSAFTEKRTFGAELGGAQES